MNHIVYSTAAGRHCPKCGKPVNDCVCKLQRQGHIVGDGKIRLQKQTKGRKGKGVTLISGLPLTAADLKKLAKELKQACGTGGAVKDGIIEIQGDQITTLEQILLDKGYSVKKSGG